MKTKNISINNDGFNEKELNEYEKLFLSFKFTIIGEDDILDDVKLIVDNKNKTLKYIYYNDDLKKEGPVQIEFKDSLKNNINVLKKIKKLINNSLDIYIKDLTDISKRNDAFIEKAIDDYIKTRDMKEKED